MESNKCGNVCAEFRKSVLNMTQQEVAEELNYSQENISAFEKGRNYNNQIFLWYVKKGLFSHYSINDVC